jgi:hypothetical protein
MTFDEWYSANIAPTLPTDAPPALLKAARESMAACWNAAVDASGDRICRCCCGHQMSEDHQGFGKCKIAGCDCMNACSCWDMVFDCEEHAMPRRVNSYLAEVKAKA